MTNPLEPLEAMREAEARRQRTPRIPELAGVTERHYLYDCIRFVTGLDTWSDAGLWHDLDEVDELFNPDGSGWVEDEQGGAELIFLPSRDKRPGHPSPMAGPLACLPRYLRCGNFKKQRTVPGHRPRW